MVGHRQCHFLETSPTMYRLKHCVLLGQMVRPIQRGYLEPHGCHIIYSVVEVWSITIHSIQVPIVNCVCSVFGNFHEFPVDSFGFFQLWLLSPVCGNFTRTLLVVLEWHEWWKTSSRTLTAKRVGLELRYHTQTILYLPKLTYKIIQMIPDVGIP